MRFTPTLRRLLWLLLPASLAAQSASADRATAPRGDTELRKIDGVFASDLPKTERKGSLRLIVHPHFGDFSNRDYLRVLTGLRWGVNDHVELSTGVESYLDHGLKETSQGNGLGDLRFGGKYGFREKLFPGYDTSVGLNLYFPVGHPPVTMTNGHNRYAPFIVIGKKIDRYPGLTLFANTGLSLSSNARPSPAPSSATSRTPTRCPSPRASSTTAFLFTTPSNSPTKPRR